MNYILFDGPVRDQLLPFTFTRPVADIRVGILTIREKWEHLLGYTTTTVTEDYLSEKYPMVELEANILINGAFLPSDNLAKLVKGLQPGQALFYDDEPLAFFAAEGEEVNFDAAEVIQYSHKDVIRLANTWDIFKYNGDAIARDFAWLTRDKVSQPIAEGVHVIGDPDLVFIEEGAKVYLASLNTTNGPIYIGKDAEIMEACTIRGPFAICEHSTLKMGAKIYGGTTVGPHCKVGGEVSNSVLFAYTNKGHEGFLGNSVLGEWCNIGADSNNSNLKNNYAPVRLWDYSTEGFAKTGLQFCGLMMGDHSKCGINTMFNTGTVVGVSANIYGGGFPRNFIPSYSWGGSSGMVTYKTNKAFETAKAMMGRRKVEFTHADQKIMEAVFQQTAKWRRD